MSGGTGKDLEHFIASFHSLPPAAGKSAPELICIKEKAHPVWLLSSNASGIEEIKTNLCARALSL